MALTITQEPIAHMLDSELRPLLVDHREELTTNKALMQLAPDVERYAALEAAGVVLALVARDGDLIVGYSINFVAQHLHYASVRMCTNDVLFVAKSHRATLGLRLIHATEEAARERGAQVMAWHAKPDTHLEAILRRRECRVQDIVFTKEL